MRARRTGARLSPRQAPRASPATSPENRPGLDNRHCQRTRLSHCGISMAAASRGSGAGRQASCRLTARRAGGPFIGCVRRYFAERPPGPWAPPSQSPSAAPRPGPVQAGHGRDRPGWGRARSSPQPAVRHAAPAAPLAARARSAPRAGLWPAGRSELEGEGDMSESHTAGATIANGFMEGRAPWAA